jgi:hypothetical protein
MKSARLFILLFFIPITFHAQQKTLTGLWTGTLTNDSSTVRRDQSYEIVLTQYKNKVYGYSRSTFIVNDTLYYIMKRVKGTIDGNVCEVKDDEILSFNFRGKLDKGVKVSHTFSMNSVDSTWTLSGDWTTNKTKKFYAVTGKVDLKDEPDISKSKIFPHLEELNLAKDVPFYAEAKRKEADEERRIREANMASNTKKNPPAKNPVASKPEPKKTEPVIAKVDQKKETPTTVIKPEPQKSEPIATVNREEKKPVAETAVVRTEPKKQEPVATVTEEKKAPVQTTATRPEPKRSEPVAIAEEKKQQTPPVTNPEPKKQQPVATVTEKPTVTEVKKQEPVATVTEEKKKPAPVNQPVVVPVAAIAVNERRTAPPQEVTFRSDSIVLSLYDNGEVDGDTVSVLMNGDLIIAKQGLKTSAIKKTIYVQPGTDEITVVLYAENLGKYPPNTGLLVVYDGDDRYQIRFSADLTQNASVVFRRKK